MREQRLDAGAREMEQAERHLARGHGRLALTALMEAAHQQADLAAEPAWWELCARAHAMEQDHDAALAAIDRGLAHDPRDLGLIVLRADLCGVRGELAEAERLVLSALRLAPDDPRPLSIYARVLSRGGEHAAAAAMADRALAADTGSVSALTTRMLVARAAGDPATEGFARSILATDPGNVDALLVTAHDRLRRGDFSDARRAADAAAQEVPGDACVTEGARELRRLEHWSMWPIRWMGRSEIRSWGVWIGTYAAVGVATRVQAIALASAVSVFLYSRYWPAAFDRLRRR